MASEFVLVIDHSKTIHRMVEAALTREGYEVLCTGTSAAAIQALNASMPRLILLDPAMPGLKEDGVFQALTQISNVPGGPIVVVATSDSGEATRITTHYNIAVAETLEKPFAAKALKVTVGRLIKGGGKPAAAPAPAPSAAPAAALPQAAPPELPHPGAPAAPRALPASMPPPPAPARPRITPTAASMIEAASRSASPAAVPPAIPAPQAPAPPPASTPSPAPAVPLNAPLAPTVAPEPMRSPVMPAPPASGMPPAQVPAVSPRQSAEASRVITLSPKKTVKPADAAAPPKSEADASPAPTPASPAQADAQPVYEFDCPAALVSGREALVYLNHSKETGLLTITSEEEAVYIYFDQGQVTFVTSTSPALYLEESDSPWKKNAKGAAAAFAEQERTGKPYIVSLNQSEVRLRSNQLTALTRKAGEGALVRSLSTRKTRLRFAALTELPDFAREYGQEFSLLQLLLLSYRSVDTWEVIEKEIAHSGVVVNFTRHFEQYADQLDLSDVEAKVVSAVDGHRSIAEIAQETGCSTLEVGAVLYGFIRLGLIAATIIPDSNAVVSPL